MRPLVFEKSAPVLLRLEVGRLIRQRAFSSLGVENWKGFAWLSWRANRGGGNTVDSDCKRGCFMEMEERQSIERA